MATVTLVSEEVVQLLGQMVDLEIYLVAQIVDQVECTKKLSHVVVRHGH